jgi:hypothetical protein
MAACPYPDIVIPCLSFFQYVFIVAADGSSWFPDGLIADLEGLLRWEIAYAGEAEVAGETARDLFERDRDGGIDFDLPFFEAISPGEHERATAYRRGRSA